MREGRKSFLGSAAGAWPTDRGSGLLPRMQWMLLKNSSLAQEVQALITSRLCSLSELALRKTIQTLPSGYPCLLLFKPACQLRFSSQDLPPCLCRQKPRKGWASSLVVLHLQNVALFKVCLVLTRLAFWKDHFYLLKLLTQFDPTF